MHSNGKQDELYRLCGQQLWPKVLSVNNFFSCKTIAEVQVRACQLMHHLARQCLHRCEHYVQYIALE